MEDNKVVEARTPGLTRQYKWMYASIVLSLAALLVVSAGFIGQRLMLGLLASQNATLRRLHKADLKRIQDLEQRTERAEVRVQQNVVPLPDGRPR